MGDETQPLATVAELQERLPFDMDDMEQREATGALEYLSDEARTFGQDSWATPATAPQAVRSLVLKAAIRHMKSYEGYVQSRAGDETLVWSDRGNDMGSASFTDREIDTIRKLAGQGGLKTAPVFAWRSEPAAPGDIFVPTASGADFPFYAQSDAAWLGITQ